MKTNTYGYNQKASKRAHTRMSAVSVRAAFYRKHFFRLWCVPVVSAVCVCIQNVCMCMYIKQCSSVRSEVRWCHSDAIFVCGIVCAAILYFSTSNLIDRSTAKNERKQNNIPWDVRSTHRYWSLIIFCFAYAEWIIFLGVFMLPNTDRPFSRKSLEFFSNYNLIVSVFVYTKKYKSHLFRVSENNREEKNENPNCYWNQLLIHNAYDFFNGKSNRIISIWISWLFPCSCCGLQRRNA